MFRLRGRHRHHLLLLLVLEDSNVGFELVAYIFALKVRLGFFLVCGFHSGLPVFHSGADVLLLSELSVCDFLFGLAFFQGLRVRFDHEHLFGHHVIVESHRFFVELLVISRLKLNIVSIFADHVKLGAPVISQFESLFVLQLLHWHEGLLGGVSIERLNPAVVPVLQKIIEDFAVNPRSDHFKFFGSGLLLLFYELKVLDELWIEVLVLLDGLGGLFGGFLFFGHWLGWFGFFNLFNLNGLELGHFDLFKDWCLQLCGLEWLPFHVDYLFAGKVGLLVCLSSQLIHLVALSPARVDCCPEVFQQRSLVIDGLVVTLEPLDCGLQKRPALGGLGNHVFGVLFGIV